MWANGVWSQTTPKLDKLRENGAQALDNPWRNCALELDNCRLKIFMLEIDTSNWKWDTSLYKIVVLELINSYGWAIRAHNNQKIVIKL